MPNKIKLLFLIVDNNPDILKIISLDLEDKGHLVSKAKNGKQALKIILNERVDVVISDIEMKNGDGIWLLENIRGQVALGLKIIMMTGLKNYSLKKIKEMGALDIIKKPFSSHTLEKCLKIITMEK